MSTHQYILTGAALPSEREHPRLLYVTYAHYSREWRSQIHSDTCSEMFFITGGNGAFLIREGRFPVAINDLVVVDPGVPHTETIQNGSPMEYVVLGLEGLEAAPGGKGHALLHLFAEDAVSSCLRTLIQESRECSLVRQYIDNHFKENLSLDQLAELAHVNKYYLAHAIRREFDTSPISYLISRRIRESRFLLAETDHTLSQIAQILGFSP